MGKKIQVELEAKTDKALDEIKDLKKQIEDLNKSVTQFGNTAEKQLDDVGKTAKKTSKVLGGISNLFKTALGAGLLVKAFDMLKDVFRSNQAVADVFSTTFETLSIAFNDFVNFLVNNVGTVTGFFKSVFDDPLQSIKDLGSAIKNNIIERLTQCLIR